MPSVKFIVLTIDISAGVTSVKSFFIDLFNANAEDKIHIVKNSIKHIMLIENTVVFILLFICLNTKAFKSFKYIFLFDWTNFSKKPERDQKNKNVPTIPRAIAVNNSFWLNLLISTVTL